MTPEMDRWNGRLKWTVGMDALLNVSDDIIHKLDNEFTPDMVYLDFSKAFDKGDHSFMLHIVK